MAVRSTPDLRAIDSHFGAKDFGGPESLWHGSGCTCARCVSLGYACWCGDSHCENPAHERMAE